jgi:phospholipid/cholesterol/gamma-HCH transport system substrate-binding protein
MPQKKQTSLSGLRVGLLVLASLVILVMVIFAVSGDLSLPFVGRKTIVKTYMARVDGLRKGAEVRLSGKQIGSVKDVNFSNQIPGSSDQANNLEIVMEISGSLNGRPAIERIRTDSLAVLKANGVLGDNVIDITPGTTKGEPIQNYGVIRSVSQKNVGDILNTAQTAVANLNDISDDVKELTRRVRAGEGTVGKFVSDDAFFNNLNRTALQAEKLLNDIRSGQGTAGRIISDPALYNQVNDTVVELRRVIDQVNEQILAGRGTIGKLIKDEEIYNRANSLVAKLDETSARVERTMAKIERGEGNLGKLINDEKLYQDTRNTVENLRAIVARMERGEGTAGLLLKDERLYQNVNTLSAEITKLLYDFRQNPRKYLSIKVSLF